MTEPMVVEAGGGSPRGSKRKAEELQLASKAPKRIKVEGD